MVGQAKPERENRTSELRAQSERLARVDIDAVRCFVTARALRGAARVDRQPNARRVAGINLQMMVEMSKFEECGIHRERPGD